MLQQVSQKRRCDSPHGWFRWLILAVDALLRRIGGVTEFEAEPEGLLRIARRHAGRPVALCDGVRIERGAPVLELHFWNEHLPPFPSDTATFDWARYVEQRIEASLCRLARHMQARGSWNDIQALRVHLSTPKHGPPTVLVRLLIEAGFDPVEGPVSAMASLLSLLDGVWAWMLTWACNPRGLVGWRFDRERREYWFSRSRFLAAYTNSNQGGVPERG